jgi:uncharacterized protein DUF1524
VDIDHLVPLAEAWDSGARTWSSGHRRSFANDVGDSRSLVAVTDNVNQSKGDQDPAEWLPRSTGNGQVLDVEIPANGCCSLSVDAVCARRELRPLFVPVALGRSVRESRRARRLDGR